MFVTQHAQTTERVYLKFGTIAVENRDVRLEHKLLISVCYSVNAATRDIVEDRYDYE